MTPESYITTPLLFWRKLALRLLFLVKSTLLLVGLIYRGDICTVQGGYGSASLSTEHERRNKGTTNHYHNVVVNRLENREYSGRVLS